MKLRRVCYSLLENSKIQYNSCSSFLSRSSTSGIELNDSEINNDNISLGGTLITVYNFHNNTFTIDLCN